MTDYNPNPAAARREAPTNTMAGQADAPTNSLAGQTASPENEPLEGQGQQKEKPTRADEIRQERRRKRGSVNALSTGRLALNESELDRNAFSYRLVRDEGNRIKRFYDDDWDPAPERAVESNDGEGTVNMKYGGVAENGDKYNLVLMRKRKDWYDSDRAEKHRERNRVEKEIRRGMHHKDDAEIAAESGFYTPGGGNKLS